MSSSGLQPPDSSLGKRLSPIASGLLGLSLVLTLALIVKLYVDGYIEIERLEAKLEAERKRLAESHGTLSRLDAELKLLKTDEGVEMVARDKLKFIRPDEVVVMPLK